MPSNGNTIIDVKKVSKQYWREKIVVPVLNDISFSVPEGEFIALMGPSGSGKTTLLNLIAGIDQPTSGTIQVNNIDIGKLNQTDLAKWRAQHVGFVFQFYNLLPVLTAYENVELPLLLTKLPKEERRKHVETALNLVGLGDRMKHYPKQLSGGQEQRVAIARAIVTNPKIIVADEPTGDLDAESAAAIMQLLTRLNRELGRTLLMVTHDAKCAAHARHTLHLEKGRLVEAHQLAARRKQETQEVTV
jgi:putative ABC transport system ATP-binding protein